MSDPMTHPVIENPLLELGEPRHGWLPIRIQLGEFEFSESVSNVLNDPVEELIEWGVFVREGTCSFRRVCLWLEPKGFAVDVRPCGPDRVGLNIWYEREAIPPMIGNPLERVFDGFVVRESLQKQVFDSLQSWLETWGEQIALHWRKKDDADFYRRLIDKSRRHE